MTNRTIDNYMTVKEAAYRWDVELRTLRERLNGKRRPNAIKEEIDRGLIKYFKTPDAKHGEWIISREAMEKWYGKEPKKS